MASKTFTSGTVVDSAWLNDVNSDVYNTKIQNVLKYYTTDLGTALQAAHNALGPDGGTILIPASNTYYTITSACSFTKPIRLIGEGWYNSEILTTTLNLTCISTTSKLDVENISFTALSAASGTAVFIKTLSTASSHGHTLISNCSFDGALYSYWSLSTNALVVENCVFGAVGGACLFLENTIDPDTGDSFISNNTFGGTSTTICIKVPSTSGINFVGNKFNSAVVGHVLVSAGTAVVGNYLFSSNSFEGHVDYAIKFIATTGIITKVVVTGNQFSSNSNTHIVYGNGTTQTTTTGNVFNSTSSTTGAGIVVETGATNHLIEGNNFHQMLTAISLGASGVGASVLGNRFANDVTNICSGDSSSSSLTGTKQIAYTKFATNTSNTTYVDVLKVAGYGTLDITIYGIVQGAGLCNYHRKVLLSDTAITDIDAVVTSGSAFDVQIAPSGGFAVISIKRNGATGTSVDVYVDIVASGKITEFKKI